MPLITRVSRLFKADLHAVLDRIEEPEVLLRQAIREMEEASASDRRRLQLGTHEQRQLGARIEEIDTTLGATAEELAVCFELEQDELARSLIRRRLEAEGLRKALERRHELLRVETAALEKRLGENQARLESMRQKAELLAADDLSSPSPEARGVGEVAVRDEDVEVAFLREKQRWSTS